MSTLQEGESVTIWRSSLKRMAERFEAAAEEYRSQHGGQSLSLALFHFDKRFRSHYKATRCRVARQFVSEDSTSLSFIIEAYEKKRDCSHLMSTHVGGIYSENPPVLRNLCSNMCLRTKVELELGLLPPDQLNERTERYWRRFQSLIEEASRCLTFLPFDWRGRFEKASLLGGNYRWMWCLFDIAWKRLPGLPLVAGQYFFIDRPNCSIGSDIFYDPKAFQENWDWATHGWCRTLEDGSIVPDVPTMPAEWEGRQPECYFSIVKDFYGQSVHFIDWLLSQTPSAKERLHIDDIDSCAEVRAVPPSAVAQFLTDGRIEVSEDSVKRAIEEILDVPFHHRDRPNELNDVSTANVIVNGSRRPTAFMLKGPGIRSKELTIAHCGKHGDQLIRLFDTAADLFVVQFVGRISEMIIKDVEGKIAAMRQRGKHAQFLIVDGQDTARLLRAYGKLNLP